MHPNATASAFTTAGTALVLYVAHRLGYAHVTSEEALLGMGATSTAILWIGRRGLKATVTSLCTSLWNGSAAPKPATTGPPPAIEPPA